MKEEGIITGYMQQGDMIECGSCEPSKYQDCKKITLEYPHIICRCKCHKKPTPLPAKEEV